VTSRPVYLEGGVRVACPVYPREELYAGQKIQGPALIQEYATVSVIFPGDACEVAESGELIISIHRSHV
jgi:N-methylhydantoinase A